MGAERESVGPHVLLPTHVRSRVFTLRPTDPHRGQLQRWDLNPDSVVPKPEHLSQAFIKLQTCKSTLCITLTLIDIISTLRKWHGPCRISTKSSAVLRSGLQRPEKSRKTFWRRQGFKWALQDKKGLKPEQVKKHP